MLGLSLWCVDYYCDKLLCVRMTECVGSDCSDSVCNDVVMMIMIVLELWHAAVCGEFMCCVVHLHNTCTIMLLILYIVCDVVV